MAEAIDRLRADYDAVPYVSHAFPQTAPGRLAAIAHVFGLDVPKMSTARVLEIGCSAGGNLIPFAAWHPDARVVGIDLSRVQIDQGRQVVQSLGLGNLELRQGDIASIDLATLGQFDFIICHGVYSWVPPNVQEAILSTFRQVLAPGGVAHLSYNVYPGWKAKEIIRDAMLLRGGDRTTAEEKLSYARGMIDFLAEVAPAGSVLAKALEDFKAERGHANDYYVLHEQLEAFNAPCYFLDLGRRADPHQLAYLADAEVSTMFAVNYGEKVAVPLLKECGHSQVLVEQYLDFVVNRTFRQSLLVHGERAPQISYRLDRSRFDRLHFALWMPPKDGEPQLDETNQEFSFNDRNLFTQDPGVKAAINALNARWPWTLSRRELINEVHAQLGRADLAAAADQEDKIDELLEALIIRGLAKFRLDPVAPDPPRTPPAVDEPIRRMAQLARGRVGGYLVNRWHEGVPLSVVDTHLLPLMDGTRDRDALIEELFTLAGKDVIRFDRDGRRLSGADELRAASAEWIDTLPQRLPTI